MRNAILFILLALLACDYNGAAQAPVEHTLRNVVPRTSPDINLTAILGAFPPELELLHKRMEMARDTLIERILFTRGTLNGRQVVMAQTGIGKVNAAVVTTLLLEHFRPGELIFSGIAGGVNPALSPGDLVIANKLAYHDYGTINTDSFLLRATRNPYSMQENPIFFLCDSVLVSKAVRAGKDVALEKIAGKSGLRQPVIIAGVIVTGDVFVASGNTTQRLRSSLQADATEMEGAAVAQVCWQQQTPFVVFRSLSDDAGNHASMDVKTFYAIAARNAASLVIAIMPSLHKHL